MQQQQQRLDIVGQDDSNQLGKRVLSSLEGSDELCEYLSQGCRSRPYWLEPEPFFGPAPAPAPTPTPTPL